MDEEVAVKLRSLFDSERVGVLATSGDGGPYTSLLAFDYGEDFKSVIICTARSTQKFYHMTHEPRVAFLIDNRHCAEENFYGAMAVTALGSVQELKDCSAVRDRFLMKNPGLTTFLAMPNTAVCCMTVHKWLVVDQFQKTTEIVMAEL